MTGFVTITTNLGTAWIRPDAIVSIGEHEENVPGWGVHEPVRLVTLQGGSAFWMNDTLENLTKCGVM